MGQVGLGLGGLEWSLWWPPRTTSAQVHCGPGPTRLRLVGPELDLYYLSQGR